MLIYIYTHTHMLIYLHIINTFWGWGSFGCLSQAAQQDHHPPEIWISHQLVHLWNSFSHSNSQGYCLFTGEDERKFACYICKILQTATWCLNRNESRSWIHLCHKMKLLVKSNPIFSKSNVFQMIKSVYMNIP